MAEVKECRLHTKCIDDLQESKVGIELTHNTILGSSGEDIRVKWNQQVVQKPAEDGAYAVYSGLPC